MKGASLKTAEKERRGSGVAAGDGGKPSLGRARGAGSGGIEPRKGRTPVTTMLYVKRVEVPATAIIARGMVDAAET